MDSIKNIESTMIHQTEWRHIASGITYHNGYITNSSTGRKLGLSYSKERENLRLRMCPNKYLLGNNVEEVSMVKLTEFFEELSHVFSYNFGEAPIQRIDATHTLITELDPRVYFTYLCNERGHLRYVHGSSLYYNHNNEGRLKVFYDKVREVDERKTWGGKQKMPTHLRDKNLTRFELRLNSNKQVQKAIMPKEYEVPRLGHLLTFEKIENLNKYWKEHYKTIPKMTELPYDFTKIEGASKVKKEILMLALASLGRNNVENLIKQAEFSGALKTKKQRSDAREILKPFQKRGTKSNHILELDEKIKNSVPSYD